jgi:UDP-N-acetylmuramate dehydrogenase
MASQLDIQSQYSLRALNTFGIDAKAAHFLEVTDIVQLDALYREPSLRTMPRLVLGGGSNLLFTQDFSGLVLHIATQGIAITGEDGQHVFVTAQAGENWHAFVQWTLAQGLPGLENLSLIPGSVGASPIQNIGAYGSEVADCFHACEVFDLHTGQVRSLNKQDCHFAYRDSVFKHDLRDRTVIINVTFALPKQWQANVRYAELANELATRGLQAPSASDISQAVIAIRSRKLPDPAKIGNAGSFFKNPVVTAEQQDVLLKRHPSLISYPQTDGSFKLAAGWLIEQCGWKGKTIGAAGVHAQHALVLVNHGGASGADLLRLANQVRDDVLDEYGVMLEAEPLIV